MELKMVFQWSLHARPDWPGAKVCVRVGPNIALAPSVLELRPHGTSLLENASRFLKFRTFRPSSSKSFGFLELRSFGASFTRTR